MTIRAVEDKGVSIRVACRAFDISESCYRYETKLSDENAEIAGWLLPRVDSKQKVTEGQAFSESLPHIGGYFDLAEYSYQFPLDLLFEYKGVEGLMDILEAPFGFFLDAR